MCPKSILSNLLVLSGAFPFLFATNLFPQYRLNCFLRVQKHRSAEGILDIGEEDPGHCKAQHLKRKIYLHKKNVILEKKKKLRTKHKKIFLFTPPSKIVC